MNRFALALWSLAVPMFAAGSAAACTDPVLTLQGGCPARFLLAQADGMFPGSTAYLYFSPRQGSYTFPPLHMCEGVQVGLDVRRLYFVGSTRANEAGTAVWRGEAGPGACGGFLQVLDNHCSITNVAQIP